MSNAGVDVVRGVLVEGGFQQRENPLRVADLEIEMAEIFEGPTVKDDLNHDLVLVADLAKVWVAVVERRLQGLLMALDRTGSTRPVTLILIEHSSLQPDDVLRLRDLCRVFTIPGRADAALVGVRLAPILPLKLPDPNEFTDIVEQELQDELRQLASPLRETLRDAATAGVDAVEVKVIAWIEDEMRSAAGESREVEG